MRTTIDKRVIAFLSADYKEGRSLVIDQAMDELAQYFEGERQVFAVPLLLAGSEFQQRVWKALLEIPFGETRSYQALADKLDKSDAIRAVASANGANALSIFVPCHRVIGSDGSLTGYAGGLPAKQKLLRLEQRGKGEQGELF